MGRAPGFTQDPPPLVSMNRFYLDAFWELTTERQIGMGLGPIPWSRIIKYGQESGLDPGMRRVLLRVIREFDEVWLRWQRSNSKSSRPPRDPSS